MSEAGRRKRALPHAGTSRTASEATPSAAAEHGAKWFTAVALLLLVTAVAYRPVLEAGFLRWDDHAYVTENRLLRDEGGLAQIWTPFSGLPAFYPMVFSSYWIEYQIWRLDPTPYHATNVVLHLINVLLVIALAERLGASRWVALGAAAVFALHPTQVESVAWVAERKNTLSTLFYLTAFLLYLNHRKTRKGWPYGLCLLAYAAALLSKTQTLTLPIALFLFEWLAPTDRRRQSGRLADATIRLLPMLALGGLAAGVTMKIESGIIPEWYDQPDAAIRPFIAANAAWFYVGKFLLPIQLAPIYPKWQVDLASPIWWLGLLAWPAAFAAVWRWGRRIPPLARWGGGQFLVSLVPVLGLVPFAWQNFSHVGNHFLYLSCIGGGLAVAVVADAWLVSLGQNVTRPVVAAIGLVLLLGLAVQTMREAHYWHDDITFWSRAVERNPNGWEPLVNLGRHQRLAGRHDDAMRVFRRAIDLAPENSPRYQLAFQRYFRTLGAASGPAAVIEEATAEIDRNPGAYIAYLYRGMNAERLGRNAQARADYERTLEVAGVDSISGKTAQQGLRRLQAKQR